MAFVRVGLLLLLIACYFASTIAGNLDFSQESFLQTERYSDLSEDADISSVAESVLGREVILPDASESSLHEKEIFRGSRLDLHDVVSSISSLLEQNGLPIGLLPSLVASYTITDDGEFAVLLQKACYVKFDYEVYYARTITGKLSYGAITDLWGIQAKEAFFWVPVTGIRTDIPSSNYIYFDVGPISKKLPISQFEIIPVCNAKAMPFRVLA